MLQQRPHLGCLPRLGPRGFLQLVDLGPESGVGLPSLHLEVITLSREGRLKLPYTLPGLLQSVSVCLHFAPLRPCNGSKPRRFVLLCHQHFLRIGQLSLYSLQPDAGMSEAILGLLLHEEDLALRLHLEAVLLRPHLLQLGPQPRHLFLQLDDQSLGLLTAYPLKSQLFLRFPQLHLQGRNLVAVLVRVLSHQRHAVRGRGAWAIES
mmetsp:Transcript_14121/g.32950  ORF Transcript_14121/g.32950 Transcript_14121/m.32950 type:complete len:207 (-) Transcript_14121:815-1435(-)